MNLRIQQLVGPNCITIEDGLAVYKMIFPELQAKCSVELDFSDVKLFASPFFNAAIGQLYKDFSSDDLNNLLKMRGLTANGSIVLRKVTENAKIYYSSERARTAIESIVNTEEKGEEV
jgi:hypothetical protein